MTSNKAAFSLIADGAGEALFATQGMATYAVLAQTVRFAMPKETARYAAQITLSMQVGEPPAIQECAAACSAGGQRYAVRHRHATFTKHCSSGASPPSMHNVVGFAGLPEVDDNLYRTAPLTFSLGGDQVQCEASAMLRRALASASEPDRRDRVCNVWRAPHQYVADPKVYTRLWRSLVDSPDPQLRVCAARGLAHFATPDLGRTPYQQYVEPAAVKDVVTLLARALGDSHAEVREGALHDLRMMQSSIRSRGGNNTRLWQAFVPAMPILIKLTGDSNTPPPIRAEIIDFLRDLGKHAAPAVPMLGRVAAGKDDLLRSHAQQALEQIRPPKP